MHDSAGALCVGNSLQNGKYVIKSILGQGGFGITYLAYHTVLKKNVAIKEFFPSVYCERAENSSVSCSASNEKIMQKLKAKFIKEAINIASLKHPNIITIFDIFEEYGTAYYVMDYVEGCSLQKLVKLEGILPENKVLKYIGEIGAALDYIHSRKIGHYDVKPGNILINKADDQSVLIDFGLSKQFTENDEHTSSLIGHSNGYAPIEQYDQSEKLTFSPTTDTYSLTATLLFLLSGIRPQTSTEIVSQGLKIPEEISDKMKRIIRKGMSIPQNKRYQSCEKLTSDLRDALDTNGIVEFVNNIKGTAKKSLQKIGNNNHHDEVCVLSVSEDIANESTSISDTEDIRRTIEKASDQPKKSIYKRLVDWSKKHPKYVIFGMMLCNILIGGSIVIGICECLNFIKRMTLFPQFNHVSQLVTILSIVIFILLLWRYIYHTKKRMVRIGIEISYALIWTIPIWSDFSLLLIYLFGLGLLYLWYKQPQKIEAIILCVFSLIMCGIGLDFF